MKRLIGLSGGRLLTCASLLLSAHFALAYASLTTAMLAFGPYKQLDGGGGPFAYRMLPALLWKVCVFALEPVNRHFPGLHFPALNKPLGSNEDWFVVLLTFAALFGTLQVARRLLRNIAGPGGPTGFEWLALGMGFAAYFDTILVLNRNLYYPYDVLALFFFMSLVALAWAGRPAAFAAVLVPAMLNKETAVMAVLVYFGVNYGRELSYGRELNYGRERKDKLVRLAAVAGGMVALAVAVRLGQRVYLRHVCPGCRPGMEHHLLQNLRQMANPLFWLSELSVFGFAYFAAIVFWRYVPGGVRRTAVVVYALWIAAMAEVGILREVRIFSELSAVLLLVVGLGVHGWLVERRLEAASGGTA